MGAKKVIDKFGSQTVLAALIGKGQSTIAYWAKIDFIPEKWHQTILNLAEQEGVNLTKEDFLIDAKSNFSDSDIETSKIDKAGGGELMPHNDTLNAINSHFLFYASNDGAVKVQVILGDETVWASQKGMADIFNIDVSGVTKHLSNIFSSDELDENSNVQFLHIAESTKPVKVYNLDAIISVGYRVNSYQATQFRKWATGILKEYLIKGFALDDERLKQGNNLFGKDYFDDLLERIRKIRTSERMFWQKVTDLYSQCSSDYDKDSILTKNFFAQIQNKFHYAIHHHTAAELIKERADSNKPNMGLVHFANMNKDGVILKSDIPVGKNYCYPEELDELERLVENYLGSAELFAKRKILMTMKDWVNKLDEFFRFNGYDILDGYGTVSSVDAKRHAIAEYEKYMQVHEKEFKSDFDNFVDGVKVKKRLPK